MEPAQIIRTCVAEVAAMRAQQAAQGALGQAVRSVKRLQSARFAGTYADLLAQGRYQGAARFFLEELYGERDFAARDAQFARIASALQRLFPAAVVGLAERLARLHLQTETLDHALALQCLEPGPLDAARYLQAWRATGLRDERSAQLASVLAIGRELDRLTRTPGLRLMLRMMRAPAQAGGLADLQHFLESGFDTFAAMRGAEGFLALIEQREAALLQLLFGGEPVACVTHLRALGLP